MHRFKFILAFMMQFILVFASAQYLTYEFKNDLKGQVRECKEVKYTTVIREGLLEPGDLMYDKHMGTRIIDSAGHVIELKTIPDSVTGKYDRTVITYLASGCLVEMNTYDEKGNLGNRSLFECDKAGKVVKQTDYTWLYERKPVSFTDYKYDKGGHLIESHERRGFPRNNGKPGEFDKDIIEHHYYEYDKNGFMIKGHVKIDGVDLLGLEDVTVIYENDAQGRTVARYVLQDDGSKKKTAVITYNDKGFISKEMTVNVIGATTVSYEYKYDDHCNWIRRAEIADFHKPGRNSVPQNIIIREITYYQ